MNWSKDTTRGPPTAAIEIAGQPTVVCPKCDEFVSPPEQLTEHFPKCSTDRRLSVLKRGPLYKKPGEHR